MTAMTIFKKKKKNRKLGWEYFKACVGVFQVRIFWWEYSRGEFPKGALIAGNFPGGNFPGKSFADTEEYIYEEFSSVPALTLIFIRKIFIVQTHSLCV